MKNCLIVAGILLVMSTVAFAAGENTATQTITARVNAISVLRSSVNPAAVTLLAPGVGGDVPADVQTTGSLAYTNVSGLPAAFKIGAKVKDLPAGTFLKVKSAVPEALFGDPGKAAAEATLSSVTSDIVTAIGSCATVSKPGAVLTYTFGVDTANMAKLIPDTKTVTVTYTLSADGE